MYVPKILSVSQEKMEFPYKLTKIDFFEIYVAYNDEKAGCLQN